MNAAKLVSSVTDDFIFDDPAEAAPITKLELADYMPVWPERARRLGADFDFHIVDKVEQDRDGALLEWYWWCLVGTDVEGSAVIRTTDDGVRYERLTYYRTPWQLRN